MDDALNKVRKFHRQIGAEVADSPVLLPCQPESASEMGDAIRALLTRCRNMADDGSSLLARLCLALEELAKWVEAHAAGDLVAAADAWGDRLYVLLGDAVAAGLPAAAIFEEVHRSNMTKTAIKAGSLGKGTKAAVFRQPSLRKILFPDTQSSNSSSTRSPIA
jgi:predicted HAD superfamily Cof-like phosphohydrolase